MFLKWTTRRHRCGGILFFASTTLLILYTFFIPFSKDSIACFDETTIGGIPDILDDETQLPVKGKSIFFHETSCNFAFGPALTITARQACAVESAARLNPNLTVFLLFTAPVKYGNVSIFPSTSEVILNELLKYNNIKIRRIDLKRYTKNTPLEKWYQDGQLQKSKYPNSHASDVLRYLSLWKYGGTYLDLDVVVMKSLNTLGVNYAAAESKTDVAAGVLNFDHQGFGHQVANDCIKEIKSNFKGSDWGYNGPGVVTRVLKNVCKTKFIKNMKMERCKGFNVLSPSSFYPISWQNWSLYFDAKKLNLALGLTKSSYAIHVWNKFSTNAYIYKYQADVAYGVIAKKFCPNVYRESGKLTPEQQKILIDIRRRKTELLLEIQQLKDELGEVEGELESLDGLDEGKMTIMPKKMMIGRKKFNMDPKKGIEYLYENGLLQRTPEDVAQFLYKGEGLNKTAIGDYLGERNDFNESVLKSFVDLHDFTDLILVQALRQFLWSFRLPGEAQKIDRMMECFAQRYCQLNPDIFTNTDTCYVLSFAIIMLNTSLHNPSVRDKPTPEQFVQMNRGINNGEDLPQELLLSLYESIKTEPFKIPEDDGNDLMHTFFNPDKEGWLWKQGGRYKSWKRRWFILNDNCLYYFEYTTDKEPRGIIPLENISVRPICDRQRPHCLELYASGSGELIKACKTDSEGKVVEGKHTVYRMSAATQEERDEWISRLKDSISHHPFYDMLASRKRKAQHANSTAIAHSTQH